jgi:hypothetical protein
VLVAHTFFLTGFIAIVSINTGSPLDEQVGDDAHGSNPSGERQYTCEDEQDFLHLRLLVQFAKNHDL